MPETYHLGKTLIRPIETRTLDEDPRGIVWLFEEPTSRATYCMGVDPTVGRTGWHRYNRSDDDHLTDNGAIEIIRIGRNGAPDVQVAEYAAPVDPYDLAVVANAMGRLYAGDEEEGQCLAIIEVYPGPGMPTQREMIEKYGYTNHFVWMYGDGMVPKQTGSLGWQSSQRSVRDLWIKGIRHISAGQIEVRSPWLVEELADCEMDLEKMRARAIYGGHDDRAVALLLAIWAGHQWSFDIEVDNRPAEPGVSDATWQASAISASRMYEEWEERLSQIVDD